MPQHVIDPMFNNENPLDVEENQLFFTHADVGSWRPETIRMRW